MYNIVGHCPKCGAPIYTPSNWMSITPPPNTYSCSCYPQTEVKTQTSTRLTQEVTDG